MQELLALPAINEAMLQKFEADLAATGSEKEQRFIIRKMLIQSGGLTCIQPSFEHCCSLPAVWQAKYHVSTRYPQHLELCAHCEHATAHN